MGNSPFVPRTRAQIATSMKTDWAARVNSLNPPQTLQTIQGSDADMITAVVALEQEAIEAQASALTANILPDQADPTYLARHGAVDGVSQMPAVAWSGKAQISGTSASAVITFGSAVLTYNGINYGSFADPTTGSPISSVTCSGGVATVRVTAAVTGSATTLPDSTILTWSSLPTNATGNATVVSNGTVVTGTDAETFASWAARIIARRQERPASGNRADWQAWALQYNGVADAYVYPNYHPTQGANEPGSVTVVPMGPIARDANGNQNGDAANADTAGGGRYVSSATRDSVYGLIEGTNDANGLTPASGVTFPQLRPATMIGGATNPPAGGTGDYQVLAATPSAQTLELQVVFGAGYSPPFTYTNTDLVIAGVPGLTATTFSIAGNQAARYAPSSTPVPILVKVKNGSTQVIRGNYYLVTPTSVMYDGTNTNFVIPSLVTTFGGSTLAVSGSVVLPAPPNWPLLRLAIFALMDGLGPGDVSPAARWPTTATRNASVLYREAVSASVQQQLSPTGILIAGVRGIINVPSVVQPGSDVTPSAFNIVSLGDLIIHT